MTRSKLQGRSSDSIHAALAQVNTVRIGTAGWTVPRAHMAACGAEGTHLERYACALHCVEVNSSFYRPHQQKTWAKWAASTPAEFRFAVKAPKAATHTAKLVGCGAVLREFFEQIAALGEKLGPVLFQLPPKLAFDDGVAREFFATVRELYAGPVVCEPRNASWFTPDVSRMLAEYEVARVAADPPKGSSLAAKPGGFRGLRYFRWHGSPRTYWSEYTAERLDELAAEVHAKPAAETWVIFDNTAMGHGLGNAVELQRKIAALQQPADVPVRRTKKAATTQKR